MKGMCKMSKTIISEGKTTSEAIEKGLKELNVSKDKVDIKILDEKKKSFFSILDPHIVKVELTLKENYKENETVKEKDVIVLTKEELDKAKNNVENFLNEFLRKISNNISFKIDVCEDKLQVEILGDDATKLIGYRGETLNSIQVILNNIASKGNEHSVKIIVDIENYREKRKKTLEDLAEKIESTVKKTGKKVTLEPMTPYERKIIHTKLQENNSVETKSIGEEPRRRVVIQLKNK